jgi:hypothetical protein
MAIAEGKAEIGVFVIFRSLDESCAWVCWESNFSRAAVRVGVKLESEIGVLCKTCLRVEREYSYEQNHQRERSITKAGEVHRDPFRQFLWVEYAGWEREVPRFNADSANHIEGATCRIPMGLLEASGHDFSRAERSARRCWALAPASFIFIYLQFRSG